MALNKPFGNFGEITKTPKEGKLKFEKSDVEHK